MTYSHQATTSAEQAHEFSTIDEDDPFSSERLCAIFSEGIVVEEDRISSMQEISAPDYFLNRRQAIYDRARLESNNYLVQQEFVKAKYEDSSKRTSCQYKFDVTKRISITQQLKMSIRKADKYHITVGSKTFAIPDIYDDQRTKTHTFVCVARFAQPTPFSNLKTNPKRFKISPNKLK